MCHTAIFIFQGKVYQKMWGLVRIFMHRTAENLQMKTGDICTWWRRLVRIFAHVEEEDMLIFAHEEDWQKYLHMVNIGENICPRSQRGLVRTSAHDIYIWWRGLAISFIWGWQELVLTSADNMHMITLVDVRKGEWWKDLHRLVKIISENTWWLVIYIW